MVRSYDACHPTVSIQRIIPNDTQTHAIMRFSLFQLVKKNYILFDIYLWFDTI
jgi:hypothetical protein